MNANSWAVGGADRVAASRLLLADLLDWHERDSKPEWWIYYERLLKMDVSDFIDDSDCIGGLTPIGPVASDSMNTFRYRFPASQEHKFRAGEGRLVCPIRLSSAVGGPLPVYSKGKNKGRPREVIENIEIIDLDTTSGTISLKLPKDSAQSLVLMPGTPVDTGNLQDALQRIARVALGEDRDGSLPSYRSAFSLLEGRPPVFRNSIRLDREEGESASDVFIRVVPHLDSSCLVVQGPPGAGKTFSLARAALECVLSGMRVGICAFKHSTLETVANEIHAAASDRKSPWASRLDSAEIHFRMQKQMKSGGVDDGSSPWVWVDTPGEFLGRVESRECQVSLATHYWFSRQEFDDLFDIVFIDEAGQLSLANTLAAATSGKSLVLVGDPQQLTQPSKGTHPCLPQPFDQVFPKGSDASALEHVLVDHKTISPDRGILLDRTWRMRPEICTFVSETMYDSRLESTPDCSDRWVRNQLGKPEVGLRWLPVIHEGNRTSSDEEVDVIAEVVAQLSDYTITDTKGTRRIGPADLMILAPYNSQVNSLIERLPEFSIGTVDKFQGEQASVVIVSMTASSAEDVPRGMEFLYSANRLNVAISRAQVLCIVVGSPTLLSARCNSVEQMKLANTICRLVETADPWLLSGNSA